MTAHAHVAPEYETTSVPTGRLGMWWFLAGELVIFGGLIACFVLLRLRHPEWVHDSAHTNMWIGAINTLVLLTSSMTVVQAYQKIDEGDRSGAIKRLLITVLLACVFLGFKAVEYTAEIRHGFTPTAGLFWSFYYLMTGLHAFHIIVGIFAMLLVCFWVKKGWRLSSVEYVGLYWHLVDVVWIFLFPLLYIAS